MEEEKYMFLYEFHRSNNVYHTIRYFVSYLHLAKNSFFFTHRNLLVIKPVFLCKGFTNNK